MALFIVLDVTETFPPFLIFITLYRYLAVYKPTYIRSNITVKKSIYLCVVGFLITFTLTILFFSLRLCILEKENNIKTY